MDAKTFFEGVTLDGEAQKILTDRYTQVSQTLESLQADASSYKEKFEGSITDRDKAKGRVRELEDKIKKGDFDGAKELKELNEKLSKDFEASELSLTEYKDKYGKLEKDFTAKVKELETLIDEQKGLTLSKIPENLKPSEDLLKKMSLKDLNGYYDGLVKQNIITDKTLHPGNNGGAKAKTLAEWKKQYMQ